VLFDLSGGGNSPISHVADATPGGRLSARDSDIKSNILVIVKHDCIAKAIAKDGLGNCSYWWNAKENEV
jgi:hypothetical protein